MALLIPSQHLLPEDECLARPALSPIFAPAPLSPCYFSDRTVLPQSFPAGHTLCLEPPSTGFSTARSLIPFRDAAFSDYFIQKGTQTTSHTLAPSHVPALFFSIAFPTIKCAISSICVSCVCSISPHWHVSSTKAELCVFSFFFYFLASRRIPGTQIRYNQQRNASHPDSSPFCFFQFCIICAMLSFPCLFPELCRFHFTSSHFWPSSSDISSLSTYPPLLLIFLGTTIQLYFLIHKGMFNHSFHMFRHHFSECSSFVGKFYSPFCLSHSIFVWRICLLLSWYSY